MHKTPLVLAVAALVLLAGIAYSTWTYSGIDLQDNQVLVFITGQSPVLVQGEETEFQDIAEEEAVPEGDYEDIELDRTAPARLLFPFEGARLSSRYGVRINPVTRKRAFHNGIDLAVRIGTPVYSPIDGTVTIVRTQYPCGNHVRVEGKLNGDAYSLDFCHLSAFLVTRGQRVAKGDPIARVGNSGRSTGPHLHYVVKRNNRIVDPLGPEAHSDIMIRGGRVSSGTPAPAPTAITAAPTTDEQVLAGATQCPGKPAGDVQIPLSSVDYFVEVCSRKYGVHQDILRAVILAESACDTTTLTVRPRAVSIVGARGLTQLLQPAVQDINARRPAAEQITFDDLFTPSKSICAGAHYLSILSRDYAASFNLATTQDVLHAYNVGIGDFRNGERNQEYVDRVTRFYQRLTASAEQLPTDIRVA